MSIVLACVEGDVQRNTRTFLGAQGDRFGSLGRRVVGVVLGDSLARHELDKLVALREPGPVVAGVLHPAVEEAVFDLQETPMHTQQQQQSAREAMKSEKVGFIKHHRETGESLQHGNFATKRDSAVFFNVRKRWSRLVKHR